MPITPKFLLAGAALVFAFGSAALSKRPPRSKTPSANVEVAWSPNAVEPFALAELLAEAPPDVVVIALDEARHPLRGAVPLAALASSDEAFVASAPKRRVVLAAFDQVRADRLARRLLARGTDARVLLGGLDAWDRAMDEDPLAPSSSAPYATWQTYRSHVALRHAFGDASLAPATAPIAAPVAPVAAPTSGAPKKREGC
jgi:hypothetical protein